MDTQRGITVLVPGEKGEVREIHLDIEEAPSVYFLVRQLVERGALKRGKDYLLVGHSSVDLAPGAPLQVFEPEPRVHCTGYGYAFQA